MSTVEKFHKLKAQAEENNARRIRAEEKYQASKKRLEEVVAEIKEAGYEDPKMLSSIKKEKEEALEKEMKALEEVLEKQEKILDSVED